MYGIMLSELISCARLSASRSYTFASKGHVIHSKTSGMDSTIGIHRLTSNPTEAWEELKNMSNFKNVTPMNLNTPIDPEKVRFVCMSDTHTFTNNLSYPVPDGDVFIHAGDFTRTGLPKEIRDFNDFLGGLPHRYKIVIAGNHDLSFDPLATDKFLSLNEKFKTDKPGVIDFDPIGMLTNCTYLQDSAVEIYGIKIYGSPWQPVYKDAGWAFKLIRGDKLLEKWNMIPLDTDILVTHCPPIGHGDLSHRGQRSGCVELLQIVQHRVNPKVHIFGHIHEGYGMTTNDITTFINASTIGKGHNPDAPTNPPIIFDIPLPPGITKL